MRDEAAERVLLIPGWRGSGEGHWQTVWEHAHPDYQRVHQKDWENPTLEDWIAALDEHAQRRAAPLVLVAHSLGCLVVARWALRTTRNVAAAMLVAPPDVARCPPALRAFAPDRGTLPFRSLVVGSDNDHYMELEKAARLAAGWGSDFVNIGRAGHINTASGFGEWPQGERLLAGLRRKAVAQIQAA